MKQCKEAYMMENRRISLCLFSHIRLFKYQIQVILLQYRVGFFVIFFSPRRTRISFFVRFFLKTFFFVLSKNSFVWPCESFYFKEENENIKLSIAVCLQFSVFSVKHIPASLK